MNINLALNIQKKLRDLVSDGKSVPEIYFSLLGKDDLQALLDIAEQVHNKAFLTQLQIVIQKIMCADQRILKTRKQKRFMKQTGRASMKLKEAVQLLFPANSPTSAPKTYRIAFSAAKKKHLGAARHRQEVSKTSSRFNAKFVQGGSPGLGKRA